MYEWFTTAFLLLAVCMLYDVISLARIDLAVAIVPYPSIPPLAVSIFEVLYKAFATLHINDTPHLFYWPPAVVFEC